MNSFHRVSPQAAEAYAALARQVRQELEAAGLPVSAAQDPPGRPGAEIEIDLGDDEGGGVYVRWNSSLPLAGAVTAQVRAGHLDHPAIRRRGFISAAMRTALAAILGDAGFTVEEAAGDYRPFAVKILRSPPAG